jgi:predicted RNA-binding Zn-ribbon protein involved in translation (DUF1610 family)
MDYNKLLQEVIAEAKRVNIPVSDSINPYVKINTRAKGRFGMCKKNTKAFNTFNIEIASFMDQASIKDIKETLAHEVLHTCPNCLNHQLQWKIYANKMNKEYGYNIKRSSSSADMGITIPIKRNYVLVCKGCGQEIIKERMCKVVKYPERFRCKCGGKLELIK